ncbi:MAG: hypothetical protein E6J43_05545 [Chloroflexi bacterium]|nr:MAG: hypothetical protein E6J43_05545 [Chloroflexota bacterium]
MPDIRRLIFTERNEEHIAAHGVTPEEVREVVEASPQIERGREGKLLVWAGQTREGIYWQSSFHGVEAPSMSSQPAR